MFQIRKARMADVGSIHKLLNFFADRRELLPRSLSEIYENLQQFYVIVQGKKVVGCCALYVTWEGLAEIKALAVSPKFQGRGLGKKLLKRMVAEAKKLGVKTLFALTIREGLFKKIGFSRALKSELPHKVWTECVRCPYFPNECIETSLTLSLSRRKALRNRLAESFMATSAPLVPSEPHKEFLSPPQPTFKTRE